MPNRLAQETSPYLQQHADNPVDWYPWGEEALARARAEDRPILLSIGYSACHWCHVMAHESFEDPSVAEVMNRLFVNVKVDREERPDLDQIYQSAHHMLTQRSGGWPLTLFLTPDGTPFFGGTYFPKTPRYNLPGFADLCERVAAVWRDKRDAIEEQNQSLRGALAGSVPVGAAHPTDLDGAPLTALLELLDGNFDPLHGGFGDAPKFPHPTDLAFLLAQPQGRGRAMALTTLTRMAEGGILDQLGGGFCRYSVDARWNIPHFEKMLYDNGPLLALYADAALVGGEPLFARVAEATATWVMREMQAPQGGYYSSLDADSEGEEGRFYVWTRAAVRVLLSDAEWQVAAPRFGLDREANFEGAHWHLYAARSLDQVAAAAGLPPADCERLLESAHRKLFEAREARVHPGRDDKILTSWNALMIQGMAHAGRVLGEPAWIASARRALDFLRATLWRDGRLLATYKDGRAHLNAYLDDHAFLLAALLELLQAEYRAEDLAFAEDLADALLERFEDRERGGFHFTSHDHERLIHRPKPGHDSATPSGNGVAALALQRLWALTGEERYRDAAGRTLAQFFPLMKRHAGGYATLCMALAEYLEPPTLVVLRGERALTSHWSRTLAQRFRPDTLVLAIAPGTAGLPPTLDKPAPGAVDRVNAWVCRGVTCLPPCDTLQALEQCLQRS